MNLILPSSTHFQRPQEEKYPVGPWLLALFVFVVCGSGMGFSLSLLSHGLLCPIKTHVLSTR
ncbi:hypothetical protein K5549_005461 [Capra hircus]|nr:hypothetical protein K5549_005461 [Capra hircus]